MWILWGPTIYPTGISEQLIVGRFYLQEMILHLQVPFWLTYIQRDVWKNLHAAWKLWDVVMVILATHVEALKGVTIHYANRGHWYTFVTIMFSYNFTKSYVFPPLAALLLLYLAKFNCHTPKHAQHQIFPMAFPYSNQRIIVQLGLEGTSRINKCQCPCHR